MRSLRGQNAPQPRVVAATTAAPVVTVYWPPLQRLFGFAAVPAGIAVWCLAAGVSSVFLFEGLKRLLAWRPH